VIINLERWNGLSEEARAILQEVAIEHEAETALNRSARRTNRSFAASRPRA
jgi:TRAP-type transport system periplasmic protein